MNFASDNWARVAPEIMAALAAENSGPAPAYGGDAASEQAIARINNLFERECAVYFVATGGAANGLALSVLGPPYGMVFCHEESHIQMDECAGPEFLTGGAKLIPIPGMDGKLTATALEKSIAGYPERPPHGAPPGVLSLTQATECGTFYSVDEIKRLCTVPKQYGLAVHMDGARFANAVAASGASAADLSWRAGVDALSFGATKNGCLAAEAVIFFDPAHAKDFEYRRKRAGQLWSKMRFISAQMNAYLDDDLWLRLAGRANAMATRLSEGLAAIEGVEIAYPTEVNMVFACFPDGVADDLRQQGAQFYPWITPGDPSGGRMHRLICSYDTQADDIDEFIEKTAALCVR